MVPEVRGEPVLPDLPPESRGAGLRLRARLLVPVLLALIPAFLLLVSNALEERQSAAQRARWRSFGVLAATAAEMDRLVDSTSQLLQILSEVPEVRRLDGGASQALLEDLLARRPGYGPLEVADLSGRTVARAGPPGSAGPPPRAARDLGQPAVRLVPAGPSGQGALWGSWPIREGRGKLVGTVSVWVDLAWVNRRAAVSDLPEGSELSVADRAGVLVVRHPDAGRWVGRTLPQDILGAPQGEVRGSVERRGVDGVARLYRIATLRQPDGTPLGTLSVGLPLRAGEAQAETALARNLVLLTLVALVSLAVAWLGGDWFLLRRLRAVSRSIHRLACLDLTARTGLGHHRDELGRLAWSFDVMAERLEQARTREVSLLESAGEGIFGVDGQGTIVFANQAAGALVGLAGADLVGRPLKGFLTSGGVAALARTLREGTRETSEEVGLWRPDGDVVPVDLTSTPMEEPPGHPGAVVVLRDVTERTRARVEVEAAHGRVLRAAQEKKAFYREVLRTVTGGRFHLVDAEDVPTEGTEVLDLALEEDGYAQVRNALPTLARQAGLTGEQAMDLLVIFGEAASNALKHGVQGRCQVFTDGDRVRVRVSDRGPGIQPERLPATLFEPGYSTRVSLGMGYTLMLQMADALWLATGPSGTVLQVEKAARPGVAEEQALQALMDRF